MAAAPVGNGRGDRAFQRFTAASLTRGQRESRKSLIRDAARNIIPMRSGSTHAAPVTGLFTQKVEGAAWRSKPSWYIVATKDRTIQPESERFVAKRMGATVFETDSSDVPMLSQPDFVLDVIRKAATAIQKNKAA